MRYHRPRLDMNNSEHLTTGRRGELAALVLLTLKGYRLRHRNWIGPRGELDLVFDRRGEVVFVEVKTRGGVLYGGAAAAVDARKRASLVHTAGAYLGRFNLWEKPSRFDIVTIEKIRTIPFWRICHVADAFRSDSGRRM
jgi:putative endonuclease